MASERAGRESAERVVRKVENRWSSSERVEAWGQVRRGEGIVRS